MVLQKYKLSTYGETKRLVGIDEALVDPLLFVEKLYVFDENGKKIGRFSVKVDLEERSSNSPRILYTHISNRAFINGKLSESVVTGTVTTKLKTLEEIRYECSEISESGKHERCMFLLREATKYYLSVTNTICNVKHHTKSSISFVEAVGLISESANIVLLRILAIKGYEGILSLKTILSNGKRFRNYYVTKLSEQVINKQRMQVLVVYRNITNHRKCNITMTLALTRAGQILYLFWSNSKCFLHVDPDAEINPHFFLYGAPSLDKYWHKDVQLYSLYLDKVDQKRIKIRSYKYLNEALRRIIGDFVEFVLYMKPPDIVSCAIEYFSTFKSNQGIKYALTALNQSRSFNNLEEEFEGQDEEFNCLGESENFIFEEMRF